jgi:hypothetical protein
MKTQRILGLVWLALCSYFSFVEIRDLFNFNAPKPWLVWFLLTGYVLWYLGGILASIFLFRGRREARWVIGFIALVVVVQDLAFFITVRQFPVRSVVIFGLALISIPLLFWPRHEPVA